LGCGRSRRRLGRVRGAAEAAAAGGCWETDARQSARFLVNCPRPVALLR
jgi:hypothetical protein